VTPSSGTINGLSSITFANGGSAFIFFSGTNWWALTGSSGGYDLIQNSFTPLTARNILNIINGTLADDSTNGSTDLTLWYQTVQQAASSRTQRPKLNFLAPVTATDNSSNNSTDVAVPVMVGDSGSGGTAGLVPAPPAGSAAAGKYLEAAGTWSVPPGGSGGGTLSLFGHPTYPSIGFGPANTAWNTTAIGGAANVVALWYFYLPGSVSAVHLGLAIHTGDATNHYDFGIFSSAGILLANVGPAIYTASPGSSPGPPTNFTVTTFLQGTVAMPPGEYFFAITSSAAGALSIFTLVGDDYPWGLINFAVGNGAWLGTSSTSSSSTLPSTITPPVYSTGNSVTAGPGGGFTALPIFYIAAF